MSELFNNELSLLQLPPEIMETIVRMLCGENLHNLRSVCKDFNEMIQRVWKSKRGLEEFKMLLQSNWRFPVQLRGAHNMAISYKYRTEVEVLNVPFNGFIDAADNEQVVLRTWNNVDITDSRVVIYNTRLNDFWEIPYINTHIHGLADQDDFQMVITPKLFVLRIQFIGEQSLNFIRVWSLTTRKIIFMTTLPNIKVLCTRWTWISQES